MKRLGIFLFYDKVGYAGRYIEYLLDSMTGIIDDLVIVINGFVDDASGEMFRKYSKNLYIRDNYGYDAMAFKEAICAYLGREKISQYSELVIFNDTFYGPFIPWVYIWKAMDSRSCDVWGITSHEENLEINWHIQSYFMVFHNSVLVEDAFWDFWDGVGVYSKLTDVIQNYECALSQKLTDSGYRLEAYCEADEYISDNPVNNYNYSHWSCGDVIRFHQMPIIKKKALICAADWPINMHYLQTLEYIDSETEYDVSIITEDLLRRFKFSELACGMGLHRIIDAHHLQTDIDSGQLNKCCLLILNDLDNNGSFLINYLKSEHIDIDMFFHNVRSDLSDMLRSIDGYKYICVLRIASGDYRGDKYLENIESARLFYNLIHSKEYVEEVIRMFEDYRINIGLISSFLPNSVDFNRVITSKTDWTSITAYMDKHYPEVSFDNESVLFPAGISGWYRTDVFIRLVLNGFFEATDKEDMRYNELALPKLIQNMGMYTVYISEASYAGKEMMLMSRKVAAESTVKTSLKVLKRNLKSMDTHLYIYGAGKIGKLCAMYSDELGIPVKAHIVSDTEEICHFDVNLPIIHLSDYKPLDKDIVIIGVGQKYADEIIKNLDRIGCNSIFRLL